MHGWQRWWQAPHTHQLRRAVLQIHLWLGVVFGLYIFVMSVSGSAIVLRPWFHRWWGESSTLVLVVEWLTLLHDELFLGRQGRTINGYGGLVFLLMLMSGAVLWWQGSRRWQQGLWLRWGSPRPLLWQLHSCVGFWAFLLMLAWGITGVYFAWPLPFELLMDQLDDNLLDAERPDSWLLFLIDLHFGRFRGTLWAALLWIPLGMLPAFLYLSGFVLWYRRLVKGRSPGPAASGQPPELMH